MEGLVGGWGCGKPREGRGCEGLKGRRSRAEGARHACGQRARGRERLRGARHRGHTDPGSGTAGGAARCCASQRLLILSPRAVSGACCYVPSLPCSSPEGAMLPSCKTGSCSHSVRLLPNPRLAPLTLPPHRGPLVTAPAPVTASPKSSFIPCYRYPSTSPNRSLHTHRLHRRTCHLPRPLLEPAC